MNLADDLNAVIIMVASCTSQGFLLLFYINIETLPCGLYRVNIYVNNGIYPLDF